MPRQSRPLHGAPVVLLTRPAAQGNRFAEALHDRFGNGLRIVASPLLVAVFVDGAIPAGPFEAVIFTSETGVEAAAHHAAILPVDAWCVGDRTAQAASAAGFRARSSAADGSGDASGLIRAIVAAGQRGPLLHLRGLDSRGDIAATLAASGIPARDHVVYEQRPLPLKAEAVGLLSGTDPVIAPLFSPRTAALLTAERDRLALPAPLRLVALSPGVAAAFGRRSGDRAWIAARPDAEAVLDAVADAFGMA